MRWTIAILLAIVVGLRVRVMLAAQMSDLPATAVATVAAVSVGAAAVVLYKHRRLFGLGGPKNSPR